jgi:protein TonB
MLVTAPDRCADGFRQHASWPGQPYSSRSVQTAALPRGSAVTTGFLACDAPRLPLHGKAAVALQSVTACLLHVLAGAALLLLMRPGALPKPLPDGPTEPETISDPPRLVFLAPARVPAGGGGGGGNRQRAPIRRAEGIGDDALTLRTTKRAAATGRVAPTEPAPPSLLLEARSLASGAADQIGLPEDGVSTGTSTGPGSGGGVGTGSGTGIGPGHGPGLGPGTGGGTGGGVYRPGGAVSAPRLLFRVKPTYTTEALNAKIQGAVWLEAVVAPEGRTTDIRVVRSLDPGLDAQAIAAVREWRFEPGRLAGVPVDVVVTVALDFQIR